MSTTTTGPGGPEDDGEGAGTTFGAIEPIEIQEEMERSFLDYAMSVIVSRALPDARDGLKPVHRRILWGMHTQGVRSDRPHVKCARVTGDVMGKYHPHGDGAIYDALVRMAQPFSLRHPLIDFHGNYGSPDFPAAASRYCVTGDTRVRVADGSSIAIADLVNLPADTEADADFEVLDKDGKPVRVDRVFNSGVHPTKRVTTKSGFSIRGSDNHPLLCLVPVAGVPMLQWLRLDEITPGTVACVVPEEIDHRFGGLFPRKLEDIPFVAEFVATAPEDELEVQRVIGPVVESGYLYETVTSVEDCEPAEVYSLRVVSEDHSFLAGGFVNHNTECRLSQLANHLLAGIDEDTVDFIDNYDGQDREPVVLPARFPNLLVNGSQGIAVGMATNIPPHNLGEVIDATLHLLEHPDATPEDLMEFVKGPDFPTGGLILGRAGILDAYKTGRGSIKMRAKAEIEEGTKRGDIIVVTELPYQVSIASVADKIKDLVDARELEGIRDIENLSAGEETRLVVYLKRDANANVVLNNLFKHTPLQTSFGVNTVALVDGVPRTLNLKAALAAYILHQVEVIRRRSEFRLKKARERAHIVEGLLKALDMIDKIIRLIRGSDDRAAAREGLMGRGFGFTEVQANHILDMRLGQLTRLSRTELEDEMTKLRETIAELESILNNPKKLRGVIKTELSEIRNDYATPRKAEITFDPGDIGVEDLIDDEPLVFTMTKAGYVKTVAAGAFRTQGRGGRGVQGAKLKEEDLVTQIIHTTAFAYLLFFSNRGRVYRLKAHEIPMKERTARGTAIVNLLPLAPDEKIQAVIDAREFTGDQHLFFATKNGQVKKTVFSEYDSSRRDGLIAINLKERDELVRVILTNGGDDIFMVSRKGQTIRFSEDDVRPMGRAAAGVIGMRLKSDDEVVSCDIARDDTDILIVTDAGYGKRTKLERFNRQGRGGQGVRGIKLTARKGFVVSAFMVGLDDEIFVISTGGVTMRIPVRDISSQGRDATGVRVMNLDAGTTVASAAPILSAEPEPE